MINPLSVALAQVAVGVAPDAALLAEASAFVARLPITADGSWDAEPLAIWIAQRCGVPLDWTLDMLREEVATLWAAQR